MSYSGFTRHTAFTFGNNDLAKQLFSNNTICLLSKEITKYLDGVRNDGKRIIVPDSTILSVLSTVFENYRPNTLDIHSRYNIMSNNNNSIDYNYIIAQTVNIIVEDVKLNIETEQQNSKLTIWTTVLGESNEHGLRSHDQIKLRKKRPTPMLFHMNY
jgi:hypothetical protein